MRERSRPSRNAATARLGALALGLLAGLTACGGDTVLEGDPLVTVAIDQQGTATQVQAGSPARLLASAEGTGSGIASVEITATGAFEGRLVREFEDRPTEVTFEAFVPVPATATGSFTLSVVAIAADGAESAPASIPVQILEPDQLPPEVAVASAIPDRVEIDDPIEVEVQCRDPGDNGQLAWCGYWVRFATDTDTVVVARRDSVLGTRTATIGDVLDVQGYDPETLPTDLTIEVHGHAIDAAGQCGAGTVTELTSGGCIGAGENTRAGSPQADPTLVTVVASRTIERGTTLPIAHFTVDEIRGLLYGSVTHRNEVEIFDYMVDPSEALVGAIDVGALPVGLSLDRTGDTLIVANSGGTSLSFVDLATGEEHSRLETHNAVLYSLVQDPSTGTWVLSWQDFGDRPSHVTQDRDGVLFYSTVSPGPIRMVENDAAWNRREAHIMLWTDVLDPVQEPEWSVTYVDSMLLEPESVYGGSFVRVWDHVPGSNQPIMAEGSPDDFQQIVAELKAQGSDIFAQYLTTWDYDYWNTAGGVLFAADADRSTIAIGDATRVWLWDAKGEHPGLVDRFISDFTAIEDLSNNGAAEGVTGVAVNAAGTNFLVRGGESALFFNELLRLHGSYTDPDLSGAGGAAMHPTEDLAFVPTGDRSVLVVETSGHYRVRAELPLVQTLVAPVTVSLPRPGDPPGLVGRLHGMSIHGDAVTLPIFESALQ